MPKKKQIKLLTSKDEFEKFVWRLTWEAFSINDHKYKQTDTTHESLLKAGLSLNKSDTSKEEWEWIDLIESLNEII